MDDPSDIIREHAGVYQVDADAIVEALAKAGLLKRPEVCPYDHGDPFGPEAGMTRMAVPLATETRTEWTTTATQEVGGGVTTDEAKACGWLRRDREWPSTQGSELLARRVHTEPWQSVPGPEVGA